MIDPMTPRERRLVLLRHGETEWARLGRHTSTTEVPLTERGAAQARAVGAQLTELALDDPLVVTSPDAGRTSPQRSPG